MNTPAGTLRRRASLGCLAVASLLLVVATAADPAVGNVDFAAAIAAAPAAARLHSLLLHWSWVLFVPGLLGLLGPIGQRGKVLATISWTAVVLGLTTFAGMTLADFFGLAVLETVGQQAFHQHEDKAAALGWLTAGWQLPGLIGWALAMLVTPLAAARAGRIGWWYPAAALPGFALYLLFAIEQAPLSLTGPLLLTAANITVALKLWPTEPAPRAEAGSRAASGPPAEPGSPAEAGSRAEGLRGEQGSRAGAGFAAWRRNASIACLIAAPLALAAGMATLPGGAFHIAEFGADPAAAQASAFFLHLGWLLFVPGIIEISGRLTGRGWVLGQIAAGIALLGLLHFNGLMIGDYSALALAQVLDPAQLEAVNARTGEDMLLALGVALPGMLGTLLGLILVPIAAARARLVSWLSPVAATLGVVAFLALTTGRLPGLAAPVLLLLAYAPIARALTKPSTPSTPAAPTASTALTASTASALTASASPSSPGAPNTGRAAPSLAAPGGGGLETGLAAPRAGSAALDLAAKGTGGVAPSLGAAGAGDAAPGLGGSGASGGAAGFEGLGQ